VRQALTDLQWWAGISAQHPENGMPIWIPTTSRTLWCDASGRTGWGAQLCWSGRTLSCSGYWKPGPEADRHITWKELRTLRLALASLLPEVQGQHLLLWEDNMPVVHIVTSGSSRSPELMSELRLLWAFLAQHEITLLPRYIRSEHNPADHWSRWRDRSAWQLQPQVMHAVQARAGVRCTLDAFACRATALLPRYCSAGPDPKALHRDAFTTSWKDEEVWLNPPWELLPRTLSKLRREKARGMLIVPRWPSQAWWPLLLELADGIDLLPHPRHIVRPAHDGMVEPFLHPSLRLLAVRVDGARAA
jgi:hypothetical protein